MDRNLIEVSVCKTGTGFSAHIDDIQGVVTTGKTFDDIKVNMVKALESHIEVLHDDGDEIPEIVQGDYELIFRIDIESLLEYYEGILTQTALSKLTGINVKQLNRYARGKSKPRPSQIIKIEKGLHQLGAELLQINL